jgi:predicted phage terminase large subunit-like protein
MKQLNTKSKRPAMTRRAAAVFSAAVTLASGPEIDRLYVFRPDAYAARVEAQEKLAAQREAEAQRRDAVPLSFREFVALVNPRYKFFKHCEVLGDVLQRVADGEIDRLMIFMPPRHGKSEETSRLFSAYFLYRYPQRWVGLASYAADLAYTLSRAAKENFTNAGGTLAKDAKAVKHWQTDAGGGFWAAGVGGPCTGKGWHLGIIDDSLKNAEQAASAKIRDKQWEWLQSTFGTREEPEGGALVLIQTRWNEDDIAARLLAQEAAAEAGEHQNWHIVNFAAIKEEAEVEFPASCTVEPDWRQPGDALCPERYNLKRLKRIAAQVGLYFWNALFQQRPRPRDGGIFKREWFKVVGAVPVGCKFVRYWDKAGSSSKGDYTAGVLLARSPDGQFFVVDVVRGQWAATEREAVMLQTAELDAQRIGARAYATGEELDGDAVYQVWIEQEPGSGGKESAQATIKNLAGFAVASETVTGDKETRADPFAAQCGVGNVFLVRGAWNEAYLSEMAAFPNGKNDDQVDGSSGAFNHLALGKRWEFG